MKKITKLLIVPIIALTLSGCGKEAKLENGDDIVAKTKQGSITANALYEKMKVENGNVALIDLIDKLILNEKYKENDEEKNYIKEEIKKVDDAAKQSGLTFTQYIKNYGFDNKTAVEQFLSLNYKRRIAVEDYIKKGITDKEIKKYYDENIFGEVNLKHILIEPKVLTGMTSKEIDEKNKEALNLAKDIIKKLNNGENFEELAKKYSSDKASAKNGGNLGFNNPNEFEEPFKKEALKLKKDTYTKEPVKTVYGYHIIYKIDSKDKAKLDDVKQTIIDTLTTNKLEADQKLYNNTLNDIRKNEELKIEDKVLNDLYNDYMKSFK